MFEAPDEWSGAPTELEDPTDRTIVSQKRRIRLRDISRQAGVIRVLAVRDFKAKYKQSVLGPIWVAFQPFALLVAFLVAFRGLGNVQAEHVPYVAFALVGLSAWAFFQAAMIIGTSSIVSNITFVRYTPCPRWAFPVSATVASLPSLGITLIAAAVATVATGVLSVRVLLLPLAIVWLVALTIALIGICSSLAVRYRDVISALPFLLQVGVFFAPVGYGLQKLSPLVRGIVEFNPMTGLIEALRWIMLKGYEPTLLPIGISLTLTVLLAIVSWRLFTRLETTMADEI